MSILRRLLIVRWAIYAVLLSGLGFWFVTSTEPGALAFKLARSFAGGYARTTPESLGGNEVQEALTDIAEESAALFVDQASALAFAAAESLPDIEELASALEGWQSDLLAYEAQLRAAMPADATAEDVEREMAELFRPRTTARPIAPPSAPAPEPPAAVEPAPPSAEEPAPAAAEEEPAPAAEAEPPPEAPPAAEPPAASAAVAFEPHPAFYKCPVIEVSNSGPVASDLTLTEYTPWVDTPAGVLIRAPVAGACLSSGYGQRMVEGASKNHAGVDYYNREGGDIFAAGAGTVTEAGEDEAYGFAVRIDHGAGVESHYAHMVPGSLQVNSGEAVKLGQPIGVMGRSGRAYAVHLHYELRFAGETVDPLYEGKRASY